MAALTANLVPREWYGDNSGMVKRPYQRKVKDGTRIFMGALVMAIDGIARPVLGGTALQDVVSKYTGADANGHVFVRALRSGVRMQFVTGGNNRSLAVTSISYGTTTDIVIQLATDGAAASTSTSAAVAALLRSHAEISKLLRCEASGDGTGLTLAVAMTAVVLVELLGVAQRETNALTAGADLAIDATVAYEVGYFAPAVETNKAPKSGGYGYLIDDATVTSDSDGLNFRCPVLVDGNDKVFIDLCKAE